MDMLSQEEIDALLGGGNDNDEVEESQPIVSAPTSSSNGNEILTEGQKDALGEIGNISMGTAATTLFTLLNQRVTITTPKVRVISWKDLSKEYVRPCVGVKIEYSEGLYGSNILVLQENDAKIIADLMMGGDGTNTEGELSELHLSAIAEAMNQMIGSSSTSLSQMINSKIDIKPPEAFRLNFDDDEFFEKISLGDDKVVCISFKMEIASLIDSEIMQIYSIDFARTLVNSLLGSTEEASLSQEPQQQAPQQAAPSPTYQQPQQPVYQEPPQQQQMYQQPQQQMYQQSQQPMYQMPPQQQQQMYQQPMYQMPPQQQQMYQQPMYQMPPQQQQVPQQPLPNVNAQPVQFQNFDVSEVMQEKENIGIIMDVPLEVTVELGRTHKLIKEILEFGPGTIIELDTLAGEPIDILVNGKFIAKGEVVVIDENFGIRVSDIINPENRI